MKTAALPESEALKALSRAGERRDELAQFLTPQPVADLMVSFLRNKWPTVNLVDAGAGAGALSHALVKKLCAARSRPERIEITAYELDRGIIPELQNTLRTCGSACVKAGIKFRARILNEDFIPAAVAMAREGLFDAPRSPFNVAIVNPPYRKIQSGSPTRLLLRSAGIETGNLYTGFLALLSKLLADGGELVAITPRSFCNGTYFKPFRQLFLDTMSLRRMHLFESRSAAFRADEVLQENIILHAVKSKEKPKTVTVSVSSGESGAAVTEHESPYQELLAPADPDQFIHLVTNESQKTARGWINKLRSNLSGLGVEVSTGRVVDFRARELLAAEPGIDTFPLIYPCHFHGGFIHWPKMPGKKPNAIQDGAIGRGLLVPTGIYVLVKRFSAKEEKRRVMAAVFDPKRIPSSWVGFENHLNYFHFRGGGLKMPFAKGLTAFLNCNMVDVYFRQFNGHTQVNANDLRNMKYPTGVQLESIGRKIGMEFPKQPELDQMVEEELL